MKNKILFLLFISIMMCGVVSASFTFDINEEDEGIYTNNAVPIVNEFRSLPHYTSININDVMMDYSEFDEMYVAHHPNCFIRGDCIRISKGTSSRQTIENDIDNDYGDSDNGNDVGNGDNGNGDNGDSDRCSECNHVRPDKHKGWCSQHKSNQNNDNVEETKTVKRTYFDSYGNQKWTTMEIPINTTGRPPLP